MLGIDSLFWHGRRVLVTGHTGFKGSWLALWLSQLGARVSGCALPTPPTTPSLFEQTSSAETIRHHITDIRDLDSVCRVFDDEQPEIVFHLAAQALVREGYRSPLDTITTNVTGTANILEAARQTSPVRAVVVVTSDKCYENREWLWPYRENESLGGHDPYSASKACAEILTAAWRSSFARSDLAIASARAGNVIGGGDWANDRLVPDAVRAWASGRDLQVRRPHAVRPWQHVLEPLHGYLILAQALASGNGAEAWNFGPSEDDMVAVGHLLDRLAAYWGSGASWSVDGKEHAHEAQNLRLDSTKARTRLDWKPVWSLDEALRRTAIWYRTWLTGADMRRYCLDEIESFQVAAATLPKKTP